MMQTRNLRRPMVQTVALAAAIGAAFVTAPTRAEQPRDNVTFLDQAWSEGDRTWFYSVTQGSVVISYDVFLNVERADSAEPFRSNASMARYGAITEPANSAYNPDGLPVGIAKTVVADGPRKGEWVGLTCAACHTGQLEFKGRRIRIDGGVPNTFDMEALVRGLDDALQATLTDPARFDRLAAKVGVTDPAGKDQFRQRFETDAGRLHHYRTRSLVAPVASGPGRMDALGLIHNHVEANMTGVAENWYPPTAPAKSPFLWNAPQSDWVQWGGTLTDPMLRNLSQSLGVFAWADLQSKSEADGLFDSTADIMNQWKMEKYLRRLAPPKWPEDILGKIDRARAAEGAQLFAQNCSGCHTSWPYRWGAARQGRQFIDNALIPIGVIGTDPTQHLDAIPWIITGPMADHMLPPFTGAVTAPPRQLLRTAFVGVFQKAVRKLHLSQADLDDMHAYNTFDPSAPRRPPVGQNYKAGPRDGAWATPPYLHNGSVPSLYEMLLPASERSKTFYIGREFDPIKVGVDTAERPGAFLFDTSLPGNSNAGHSFEDGPRSNGVIGRLLSDPERWAIVEYLKSIPNADGRITPFGGPTFAASAVKAAAPAN